MKIDTEEKMKEVSFDLVTLARLRSHYRDAVNKKEESFIMDDNEYVTNYAKYVIEYLEGRLRDDN